MCRRAKAVGDSFEKMAVDTTRFPAEVTDVYREAALRPGRDAIDGELLPSRISRRSRAMASEDLPVIETPTLMVWGLEDTALSKETTDGTDEHVADLTMRFLPGVSHWVQQEAPEIVNAMLLAWLDGSPVPEADEVIAERLAEPAAGVDSW